MTKRYCITHTDQDGERHQLTGSWEAKTPQDAIKQMLREANAEDDGWWLAWEVENEVSE